LNKGILHEHLTMMIEKGLREEDADLITDSWHGMRNGGEEEAWLFCPHLIPNETSPLFAFS